MTTLKQHLLNDEQIRHFIVNGYTNVTADLPTHIHETIYDKTDELFAGATDFRGDRQHNPLNNILPLVPELQVVLESQEVRARSPVFWETGMSCIRIGTAIPILPEAHRVVKRMVRSG